MVLLLLTWACWYLIPIIPNLLHSLSVQVAVLWISFQNGLYRYISHTCMLSLACPVKTLMDLTNNMVHKEAISMLPEKDSIYCFMHVNVFFLLFTARTQTILYTHSPLWRRGHTIIWVSPRDWDSINTYTHYPNGLPQGLCRPHTRHVPLKVQCRHIM